VDLIFPNIFFHAKIIPCKLICNKTNLVAVRLLLRPFEGQSANDNNMNNVFFTEYLTLFINLLVVLAYIKRRTQTQKSWIPIPRKKSVN